MRIGLLQNSNPMMSSNKMDTPNQNNKPQVTHLKPSVQLLIIKKREINYTKGLHNMTNKWLQNEY